MEHCESYIKNDIDIYLPEGNKTSDNIFIFSFSDLYSLPGGKKKKKNLDIYEPKKKYIWPLVLICFVTQYSKITVYMQKLPSCPHKRNHFTQFTFIHHLSMTTIFFWASYSRFFHFHYSTEGFEWFISQCLDSIRAHKQQMGSCSSDWRWNGCIWFMMDIIYKCYVNYHCCRCHCFLSLLYTQGYFFPVYISEYHFHKTR